MARLAIKLGKKKKKSGKKPGRPSSKYKFIEPLRNARRIAGY